MFKKNKKQNVYLELLRYAHDKGVEGFKWGDAEGHLSIREPEASRLYSSAVAQDEVIAVENRVCFLTFEGERQLLEHNELEHARRSSRNAIFIACGAMVINIAVSIMMISFSRSDSKSISEMNETVSKIYGVIEDYDHGSIIADLK